MSTTGIGQGIASIPTFANATERDARLPVPDQWQKAENRALGIIQRWSGVAWEDVYYAGSLSAGTPAIQHNGVTVVALPTAIDFRGSVLVVDAGAGVARVTVTGGGGGTLIVQDNGTPVGVAETINFIGFTIADEGGEVISVTRPPPQVAWKDEGTLVVTGGTLNAVGPGVVLTDVGGVATLTVAGTVWKDEGSTVLTGTQVNFVGAGVALTNVAGVATVTISGGAGGSVTWQEEGVTVIASGTANFVGTGVTVTNASGTATITITTDYSVAVNHSLIPDTDNTYDLGDATHEYRTLYLRTALELGPAPRATAGLIRVANAPGVDILAIRNNANSANLSVISSPGGFGNDYIVFGGTMQIKAGGSPGVAPTSDALIDFGDASARWAIINGTDVRATAQNATTLAYAYTRITTTYVNPPTVFNSYGMLETQHNRLVIRAGNTACDVEFRNDTSPRMMAPVSGNTIGLGSGSQPWNHLFLTASTTALAPLNMGQGTAPTSPANGDIWITSSGMYARVAGVTVGPFGAPGGASVVWQDEGSNVVTADHANFVGAGVTVTDVGGVATVTIAGGGTVVGTATVGSIPKMITNTSTITASLLSEASSTITMNGQFVPNATGSRTLGTSSLAWNKLFVREIHTDSGALTLDGVSGTNPITLQINGTGYWNLNSGGHWAPDTTSVSDLGTTAKLIRSLYLSGGAVFGTVSKTASYTLTANDFTVNGNATGGAFNLTLPAAASHAGRYYTMIKSDASANAVTIIGTVSGVVNPTLAAQYNSVTVYSDGTSWTKTSAI